MIKEMKTRLIILVLGEMFILSSGIVFADIVTPEMMEQFRAQARRELVVTLVILAGLLTAGGWGAYRSRRTFAVAARFRTSLVFCLAFSAIFFSLFAALVAVADFSTSYEGLAYFRTKPGVIGYLLYVLGVSFEFPQFWLYLSLVFGFKPYEFDLILRSSALARYAWFFFPVVIATVASGLIGSLSLYWYRRKGRRNLFVAFILSICGIVAYFIIFYLLARSRYRFIPYQSLDREAVPVELRLIQ